jgi:hypothetical protein
MGFPKIQAAYAAHGVACYPLQGKTPAVRGYAMIGVAGSAQLAMKFADATAAGFCAGRRSRLTIIDVDSTDDRLVAEVQKRFGVTPLQVATPSGRHLYFRSSGELRRIRPMPDVDILGAGNVVAAGSDTPKGRYKLVGSLDDLDRLPPIRDAAAPQVVSERLQKGTRNVALFKHLQAIVAHCDTRDQLLDAAHTWAASRLAVPLSEAEISKTVASVWKYSGGRKGFMEKIFQGETYAKLTADPGTMALAFYLCCENGPQARFWIADGLGRAKGWPYRLVPRARKKLLELGIVECIQPPKKGAPGVYRWRLPSDE